MMPAQFFQQFVCVGDAMWAPEAMTQPMTTMYVPIGFAPMQQGFSGAIPHQQAIVPAPQSSPMIQLGLPTDISTFGWQAASPGIASPVGGIHA